MTTTRIKDKLSKLVSSQLPEFVQADYGTFVTFVKAYYEFLEQDQNAQELLQNARDYNDVDLTINSFIEYFLKQYCNQIPRELLADKRLLVKKINDLYSSKGSENSYKLLFQLLYGKQVQFIYPGEQILKASDGKWVQRNSFFVEVIYGDASEFENKDCKVTNSSYQSLVPVIQVDPVIEIDNNNQFITSPNKFELFFNNINNPLIGQGDIIECAGVLARVIPSTTKASVIDGGSGFRVGDIIDIEILRGTGTRIKVIKTGPGGTIKNVQIFNYGVNYPDVFFYNYSSTSSRIESADTEIILPNISFNDGTTGVSDQGTVIKFDYVDPSYLVNPDYVGDLLSVFKYTEGNYSGGVDSFDAVFKFEKGIKCFYPGYFSTNDGFLSDDIYLEDENYYQPFSYVLKVGEQLAKYKKVVMDILHPAGMKLNAEYMIDVNVSLSQTVTNTLSFIINDFFEFLEAEDTLSYSFSKVVASANTAVDSYSILLSKSVSSANLVIDTASLLVDIYPFSSNSAIDALTYNLSMSIESANVAIDTLSFNLQSALTDESIIIDSGNVFVYDYADITYFVQQEQYVGNVFAF